MSKYFIVLFLIFSFLSLATPVKATILPYQPRYWIYIYFNGQRISDNSVFYRHESGYSDICWGGICNIDQKLPLRIIVYKTNMNFLSSDDFEKKYYLGLKGCETKITRSGGEFLDAYNLEGSNEYNQTVEKIVKEAVSKGYQGTDINRYLISQIEDYRTKYLHEKGFTFFRNPVCDDYERLGAYKAYLNDAKNNSTITAQVAINKQIKIPSKTDLSFKLNIDSGKLESGVKVIVIQILYFLLTIGKFILIAIITIALIKLIKNQYRKRRL